MNSNKFFTPSSTYVASTLNKILKDNYGYELSGDMKQLREAREEVLGMIERGEGNLTENTMVRNTIEALLKARQDNIIESTLSEDTTSDDGSLVTKTTDYDDEYTEFDVYLDGKKVGYGWLDLYADTTVFMTKDKIMDIRKPGHGITIDMANYKTTAQAIKSEVFDNPDSIYHKPIGIKDINLPKPDESPMTDKEKKDQSDWLAQQYADDTLYDSKQPAPEKPDAKKAAMRKRIEKHQSRDKDDWWDDEDKPKKRRMGGRYGNKYNAGDDDLDEAVGTAAKYKDKKGIMGGKYDSATKWLDLNMDKPEVAGKYRDKKHADRHAQHKKQDPAMARDGYAKHMVDMDKAKRKASKKGVKMRDYGKDGWKVANGVKRGKLPEAEQVNEEWYDAYRDFKGEGYSDAEARKMADKMWPDKEDDYGSGAYYIFINGTVWWPKGASGPAEFDGEQHARNVFNKQRWMDDKMVHILSGDKIDKSTWLPKGKLTHNGKPIPVKSPRQLKK